MNQKNLILTLAALLLVGCNMIEPAAPRPRAGRATNKGFPINVSPVMRGTVASETIILGYEPVVARGFGLVVGLRGTGSRDIPPLLRAHMLEEAARKGVGSRRNQWGELSPERLLDSPDTAVVIVEAVVPPGSVGRKTISGGSRRMQIPGTRFDVRVIADPRTGTTSLEGGILWTTDLRPGPLQPGGRQAFAIAQARGPIFVNPYAEPTTGGLDTVNRMSGRILNGGEVVKDLPLKLRLGRPSHQRAAKIQNAINRTFPQESGQHDPTARGESDESIEITVPPSWRDRTFEFVELLRHTTLYMAGAETVAMSVRRAVVQSPEVARDASRRWQALGPRALPIIADLYDHPDVLPRMAALRAGAKLNDPRVARPLINMTRHDNPQQRREAVQLLADMGGNPAISLALRERLNDGDIDVRLAAYESMVARADTAIARWIVDDSFVLDVVESDHPLIYVTQLGLPRIVVFGRDLAVNRPVFVRMWSNRLMIKETDDDRIEIYYREPDALQGSTNILNPSLVELIVFLGHAPDIDHPAPGLGFGYGQTVGVLHQIWGQQGIEADFKTEQDRILAAILEQRSRPAAPARPEFADPDFDFLNPAADEGIAGEEFNSTPGSDGSEGP